MKHYTDHSLKELHTFGMDVRAAHLVEYDSVGELRVLLEKLRGEWKQLPYLHIGGGSNLLFASDSYAGVILHSAIVGKEIVLEDEETVHLRVGAGVVWDDLVAYCVSQGWGGMENLSLIPGEVGASAVQNIGAYGVEAKDLITSVETIEVATGNVRAFTCDECAYGYRQSIFKGELKGKYIVTHVTYRLQKHPVYHLDYGNIRAELERMGGEVSLESVRRAVISIRESKLPDPKVTGNAGSFFMNPVVSREVMEQHAIDGTEVVIANHLFAEVRATINQDTHPLHLHQGRSAQASVSRVGRCTDLAPTSYLRYSRGSTTSEYGYLHCIKFTSG